MSLSKKLAIVIWDDCENVQRDYFKENIEKSFRDFDITFFYFGFLTNFQNYNIDFNKIADIDDLNSFFELLLKSKDNFDYLLIMKPYLVFDSPLLFESINIKKINVVQKSDAIFFMNTNLIIEFMEFIYYSKYKNLVAFNHQDLNSKFNILTFDKLNLNFYHKKSKIKSLSNKKIALVLTGVSFDHGEWLSGWGKKTYRNFLDCFENHFDKIIYPFSEQLQVEVMLTTYHSIHEESLLKIYEPKSFLFLDDKKLKMRATYLISVDNVIRKNEEFDFYIFTRFDIKFFDKLTNWNFDFDKLNCLFVENWTKHNETEFKEISDVLFAFPHKFLTKFRKSVYDSNIILNADTRGDCTGDLHYIYKYFKDNIGLENMHFIDQSLNYTTAEAVGPNHDKNPYFYLTRKHLED